MAEFSSARRRSIRPLPWTIFAPPFSVQTPMPEKITNYAVHGEIAFWNNLTEAEPQNTIGGDVELLPGLQAGVH
ncbi:MAG: hypothetical protein GY953_17725, partial [bacterium]|nr:hypothetical protein [bacterium]